MSRQQKRRHKPIERAYTPGNSNTMGIQGDYAKYANGSSVMIPANILMQMIQNLAPQKNQAKDFAPGSPLQPYQGVVPQGGPRQYSYMPGANITSNDRTLGKADIPSFQQLRMFAMLYDGVGLCERVILDMIPQLAPKVGVSKVAAALGAEDKQYQKEISKWLAFVEKPSPAQGLDIHSWLRMAWSDQTQIDALAMFKHLTRGGDLYGLEIIDGSEVKPILNERGMLPDATQGWPAYQQYPYGVPGDLYTSDQMLYYRESPRTFTPYGFSRIERIIMRVNQALRKENKDLARWTEGNVPAGLVEVPLDLNWTPDQIDAYEQQWNSYLAGNFQSQVRLKFLQAGMKYTRLDDVEINTPFDEFLLNISAAAYGLSMQDLAFTGDIHKSSGDSQQNVMYRRTLAPLVSVYARLLTGVLREYTDVDVLEVGFSGYEEVEDEESKATTLTMYTNAGILGLSNAAKLAKLPEEPDAPHIGRVFMSKDGPVFLDDMASDKMRDAAAQAKMAGFQMAANPPEPQDNGEEEQNNEQSASKTTKGDKDASGSASGGDSKPAKGAADTRVTQPVAQGADTDTTYIWRQGSCTCAECTTNSGTVRKAGEAYPSGARDVGNHEGCDCARVPYVPEPQDTTVARLLTQVEELLARLSSNDNQRPKMLEEQTGMMLAFLLDPKTAEKLAIPGGEPADNLHLTLAFLGDTQEVVTDDKLRPHTSPFKIRDAIAGVASASRPLSGKIAGIGRFTTQEEGKPTPVYASVDVPGLVELRTNLVQAIEASGYFVANDHGFTPHITLAYIDADAPMPIDDVPELSLSLDTVTLCVGNDDRAFKLGDEQYSAYREARLSLPEAMSVAQPDITTQHDVREEYRRWRQRAIDDVKVGRVQRGFSTTLIPGHIHTFITGELAQCSTPDEVRAVFERVRDAEKRGQTGKDDLAKSIAALFEDVESRGSTALIV